MNSSAFKEQIGWDDNSKDSCCPHCQSMITNLDMIKKNKVLKCTNCTKKIIVIKKPKFYFLSPI